MCGIAGILKFGSQPVERTRLNAMGESIHHRGPDDGGVEIAGRVGLAHRRLSIIDIAGGHQPMANRARNIWIAYNGEIYNFRELRGELEALGRAFTTRSDTEVVLQAYEQWGEACVARLRGMFALAIWDQRRQQLFLARDRMGIKPLYYAVRDGELLFGSEIKALVAGGLRPRLNRAVIPEFVANRYTAGDDTFFEGVHKLMPAHTLTWRPGQGVKVRRFWNLPGDVADAHGTFAENAVEVRERLEESIQTHLVSDVPVGLFLSGGLDSSGLAGLMAPMVAEPVHTFSVGFDEQGYSELGYARAVAEAIGSTHHDVVISADRFFGALPSLIWHEDEPIAFPSSVPLNFVSRLAREHVKVVMTGEGADELFLGYNRYRVTALNERLGRVWRAIAPAMLRGATRDAVGRLPRSLRRIVERSFLARPDGIRDLFCENFSVFSAPMREQLLAGGAAGADPHARALALFEAAPGGDLSKMSYADLQTYLVELLMKQDQMSMAASIESRVPFLDHQFVEYAAALPAKYKVRGWTTKAVLREALRPVVPDAVLTRPKMGFPVPVGRWCREQFRPLVDEYVLGGRARDRGLFDDRYLTRLVAEHQTGHRDHGDRLWLLINLEIWQRLYVDGEPLANLAHEADRAAA
ncbi:MAG: asparagine synthase (glutamine-hydrolyzing) [Gammaproteobacteria bacterium]